MAALGICAGLQWCWQMIDTLLNSVPGVLFVAAAAIQYAQRPSLVGALTVRLSRLYWQRRIRVFVFCDAFHYQSWLRLHQPPR